MPGWADVAGTQRSELDLGVGRVLTQGSQEESREILGSMPKSTARSVLASRGALHRGVGKVSDNREPFPPPTGTRMRRVG